MSTSFTEATFMSSFSFISELFFVLGLVGHVLAYSSLKLGVYDEDEKVLCFKGISSPKVIFRMMVLGLIYVIFTICKIGLHIRGNTWPISSWNQLQDRETMKNLKNNRFFIAFVAVVLIGVFIVIGMTYKDIHTYFNNASENIRSKSQTQDKNKLKDSFEQRDISFDELWSRFENHKKQQCYTNSVGEQICDNCTSIEKHKKDSLSSWVVAMMMVLCFCHAYNTIWNTYYNVPMEPNTGSSGTPFMIPGSFGLGLLS